MSLFKFFKKILFGNEHKFKYIKNSYWKYECIKCGLTDEKVIDSIPRDPEWYFFKTYDKWIKVAENFPCLTKEEKLLKDIIE